MTVAAGKLQYPTGLELRFWNMKTHLGSLRDVLAFLLCVSVASDAMIPTAYGQTLPARIEIVVVEGEGATLTARQRAGQNLVVRVEDDDHRPLAGASVVFALPVTGVTGTFTNGSTNLTVVTDDAGLAVARGLKANPVPGKLQIYVTASYRGLRARTLITQFVEGEPGVSAKAPEVHNRQSGGKWKWIVLGLAAAGGAGAGIYFATQAHSAGSPISITTGAVTFGSPR